MCCEGILPNLNFRIVVITIDQQLNTLITFKMADCYITLHHLLDAFIQSDLHTQYCGQSPQEQFGVKCLAQGHNDMLTAVGFELNPDPNTKAQPTAPHTTRFSKWKCFGPLKLARPP